MEKCIFLVIHCIYKFRIKKIDMKVALFIAFFLQLAYHFSLFLRNSIYVFFSFSFQLEIRFSVGLSIFFFFYRFSALVGTYLHKTHKCQKTFQLPSTVIIENSLGSDFNKLNFPSRKIVEHTFKRILLCFLFFPFLILSLPCSSCLVFV